MDFSGLIGSLFSGTLASFVGYARISKNDQSLKWSCNLLVDKPKPNGCSPLVLPVKCTGDRYPTEQSRPLKGCKTKASSSAFRNFFQKMA